MDDDAIRWRSALLETVSEYSDTPLLLSGGMDSATLLAAQLTLFAKPRCYAYRLGDLVSDDLAAARALCDHYGLELVEVGIPTDLEYLLRITQRVIEMTRNPRKTAVQCCWALWPIFEAAIAQGDRLLLTGAGGIVEDNRQAKVWGHPNHYWDPPGGGERRRSAEGVALEDVRRPNLLGGNPESATETMKRFGEAFGCHLAEPYSMQPVADVGLSIPWPEMNRPVQKGIACRAFPDFFAYGAPLSKSWRDGAPGQWWRPNVSLQVSGGVRDHHDKLLTYPAARPDGAQRVVAIYNRILREVEGDGEQLGLVNLA